jgi:hypothetical protein
METGDTGELYLKRKLRISNFSEVDTIEPYGWVYEGDKIEVNVKYPEDKEEAQKFE